MNSERPLISVIIPCYTHVNYLPEAIESVLKQSYDNIETIVVDDGSPNDVKEVVNGYRSVRYFRQRNMGVAAARNTGFNLSAGKFIVFLDADDRLLPAAIETNLHWLSAHPTYGCVTGSHVLIDSCGNRLTADPLPFLGCLDYTTMLRANPIVPGAILYRKETLLEVGGFDSSVDGAADWDLYLRIARTLQIGFHNNATVAYRKHGANMSNNCATMLKDTLNVTCRQWEHVKGNKNSEEAYRCAQERSRSMYGEGLANQIGHMILGKEQWTRILLTVMLLLKHYPTIVMQRTLWKRFLELLLDIVIEPPPAPPQNNQMDRTTRPPGELPGR